MKMPTYYRLKKFEDYLTTAHQANYIRALTNSEVDKLIEIGNELGIYYKNNHCGKCLLSFIKQLAIPYFKQKKQLEEKKCLKDKELTKEEEKEKDSQNH